MLLLLLFMMLFITKYGVMLMLFVIDFDIVMLFARSGFLCCCCCCLGHYVVVAVDLNFRFRWCCCCCYWSRHNRYNRTIPDIEHRIFLPCYHRDHHPKNNFECTFFPCPWTPLDPLVLILLLIANADTGTTILRYRRIPMNPPQQFFLRNES